jgi:lysophospholipase
MATDQLFAIEGFGPPAGAQTLLLTAADGVQLRAARWRPSARKGTVGTVLVVQGRAEFIERYYEPIAELRRRGFHVAAFDWRGQGGSDRLTGNPRKGHVRRFGDYHRDLAAVFSELMPKLPRPWFILAHSMGAALCLEASTKGELPADRLVGLAPMFELAMVERPRAARIAAAAMNGAGFGSSFVPVGGETPLATRPFAGNRLTSDPVRYARNARLAGELPALAIGDPTIRWVHEAFRFMARMTDPATPLDVRIPALIIAAGADPVVSAPAVERFAARLKTGLALVLPESRHEILNEQDHIRRAFWAAFDAFVPGELRGEMKGGETRGETPRRSGAGGPRAQQAQGGLVDPPVA